MASQYRKIEDFPGVLWDKESPVALEKMRLARDTYRGVNVLQLTFRNVSNTNIYGLSISITMKDFNGKRVLKKDIEYNYYGMEVGLNKTFGNDDYIFVEPEGKSFLITVKRAEFSDGAMFRGSALLNPMPEPLPLEALDDLQEPFTQRMQERYPKVKLTYAPEDKLHYWRCTCGRFFPHTVNKCPSCNLLKENLLQVIRDLKSEKNVAIKAAALAEKERLAAEEQARIEAEENRRQKEEAEKLRLEEEAEQKRLKKKKMQRILAYASCAVAISILLLLLLPRLKKEPEIIEPDPSDLIAAATEPSPEPSEEPPVVPEVTPSPELTPTPPAFESTPLAILGQDLTAEDMRLVLRLIGMEQEDFERFDVIYVTPQEEVDYLSGRYNPKLLGGSSLSSLLITPTEPGSGLNVTTYNITYCTVEMYSELLLESGITDADVVIAAPFKMSGTAALAGIMKAGEHLKDEPVVTE